MQRWLCGLKLSPSSPVSNAWFECTAPLEASTPTVCTPHSALHFPGTLLCDHVTRPLDHEQGTCLCVMMSISLYWWNWIKSDMSVCHDVHLALLIINLSMQLAFFAYQWSKRLWMWSKHLYHLWSSWRVWWSIRVGSPSPQLSQHDVTPITKSSS